MALPLNIVVMRDGHLLAAVTKPSHRDDRAVALMAAAVPAFGADEAGMVCECWVRHIDSDPSVPISEDPSASAAILVSKVDESGFEWMLAPYGIGDEGEVIWRDAVAVTSPIVDSFRSNLTDAVGMEKFPQGEKEQYVQLLFLNQYNVVLTRRGMGEEV